MNNKEFKTIDEQIELLKSRGLKIENEDKLKWYLSSYNYQNFINGYNDLFMINEDRSKNKYKPIASSNQIINLFNFDRWLSKNILSIIQNIERKISSSIAYVLAINLNYYNNDKSGNIFKYEFNNPLIEKMFVKMDFEEWNEMKSRLLDDKKINKNEKLYKKYNSNSEIPIWSLIIKMSFGDLILILSKVNENIFFQIMKDSKIYNWENLNSKKEIILIFKIIKDLRNRICHNNVIYNIEITDRSKIKPISGILKIDLKKANLLDIVKIIEKLDNDSYISENVYKQLDKYNDIHEIIKNLIINKIKNHNL